MITFISTKTLGLNSCLLNKTNVLLTLSTLCVRLISSVTSLVVWKKKDFLDPKVMYILNLLILTSESLWCTMSNTRVVSHLNVFLCHFYVEFLRCLVAIVIAMKFTEVSSSSGIALTEDLNKVALPISSWYLVIHFRYIYFCWAWARCFHNFFQTLWQY